MKSSKRDATTFGSIMKNRMTDAAQSPSVQAPRIAAPALSGEPPRVASVAEAVNATDLVPFNSRLSRAIYRELKLYCAESDLKQQVVVAEALREYLDKRKKA